MFSFVVDLLINIFWTKDLHDGNILNPLLYFPHNSTLRSSWLWALAGHSFPIVWLICTRFGFLEDALTTVTDYFSLLSIVARNYLMTLVTDDYTHLTHIRFLIIIGFLTASYTVIEWLNKAVKETVTESATNLMSKLLYWITLDFVYLLNFSVFN